MRGRIPEGTEKIIDIFDCAPSYVYLLRFNRVIATISSFLRLYF